MLHCVLVADRALPCALKGYSKMTSDNQETSTTSNRVALVTGGTRGIGQEISKKLKKDGFFVIANYASNDQKASDFLLLQISTLR